MFFRAAYKEALKGKGFTSPNPTVGCVLVYQNEIIARGYHQKSGRPHAEVEAFNNLPDGFSDFQNLEVYVTLEPCAHIGKTGSCADFLISKKVKKVFIATLDPFKKVAGKGVSKLRKSGIEVNFLKDQNLKTKIILLNQDFFKSALTHKTYVTLKFATSLDGKITDYENNSKWITNKQSRLDARKERLMHDAVMVGIGTVKADDCYLKAPKKFKNKQFLRIVLDPKLEISKKANILKNSNVLIVTREANKLKAKDFNCYFYKGSRLNLDIFLKDLYQRGVVSLFVEGGAKVLGSFFDQNLYDRLLHYTAPFILAGKGKQAFESKGELLSNTKTPELIISRKIKDNRKTDIYQKIWYNQEK
jgi:diaminohydroxyphosphoribosylaminopyrimidine deaminase/5-amino-6-(5-phosphoribosylamino)uracil reductase